MPMRKAITLIFALAVLSACAMIARSGAPGNEVIWGSDAMCVANAGVSAGWDFFSNYGSYMPRTHCMVTETGETDWAWVWMLVVLNAIVIAGYLRIFVFWRKAFLAEQVRDRNNKLMDLAWIFLLCAACGYVSSMVLFVWPAYRLLALALVPLAFFTWKFAWNLESFGIALRAKRLERELAESLTREKEELERRVEEATIELRRARAEAEEANLAKSRFLANMSHEIRTPMTSIIGYTDILIEGEMPENEARDSLETIRRNGTHLLGLINDILDLSRVESGVIQLERMPVRVEDKLNHVRELILPKADAHGTTVRVEIEPGTPDTVECDPTRVRQVLTNLAGNAAKFTRDGVIVLRASSPTSGKLVIEVEDTGPGMTQEQAGQCFGVFTQADASITRKHGGSGLGLAISRDLARLMGGDITLTTELGKGSTFRFELAAPETTQDAEPQMHGKASGSASDLTGRRILLVEDGADNRKLITFHLRRAGVFVETAHDGNEGIRAALAAKDCGMPFDIVLMDIQMPEKDGLSATRELRDAGFHTPIVALSAHAMRADEQRAIEAGCDAYHTKPVNFNKLLRDLGRLVAVSKAA